MLHVKLETVSKDQRIGHIKKETGNKPIPLSDILKSNGLNDTLHSFRHTVEPSENLFIEYLCKCAEHVLPKVEKLYTDNNLPRKAINAARNCITDKSGKAIDTLDVFTFWNLCETNTGRVIDDISEQIKVDSYGVYVDKVTIYDIGIIEILSYAAEQADTRAASAAYVASEVANDVASATKYSRISTVAKRHLPFGRTDDYAISAACYAIEAADRASHSAERASEAKYIANVAYNVALDVVKVYNDYLLDPGIDRDSIEHIKKLASESAYSAVEAIPYKDITKIKETASSIERKWQIETLLELLNQ